MKVFAMKAKWKIIDSVIIIDYNEMDNFINYKLFEYNGVNDIRLFKKQNEALDFLIETNVKFQFVIVGDSTYSLNGFEFIDKFNELGLHEKHGEICLLSASLNPLDKERAMQRNIRFIDKPLTIDRLLSK